MAVLFMHAFEQPKPLTEVAPTVPEPIADVVMRGLATDPTERFDSAESFGIALAEPAAGTWGSDWLTPVGIPVIGADTIVNAATRSEHPSRPTEPQDPNRMRVRPAEALPRPRIELADVGRKDVAPVQQVVKFPSPRVPVAVAAVLAVLAVAVALVGLGAPPRGGDLAPGTVTVAGVDPTTGADVKVDMTKPIPVSVAGLPGDRVALAVDVAGATIGHHEAPIAPAAPVPTAMVPAPFNPYVLAGRMTGVITVLNGQTAIATYRFGLTSTQPATTTGLTVAAAVLALFTAAYLESCLRALRRGRGRFSASVGLPLSAAGFAVAVAGVGWVLLGHQPTVGTLVASAAIAAVAGIAATVGAMRAGRTYRYRRSRRALERALAIKLHQGERWSLVRR